MSNRDHVPSTESTRTVELPERLISQVEARLSRTYFGDTAGYVTFVLEEVLATVEAEPEDENYDAVDRAKVEGRLQSLGYLDE